MKIERVYRFVSPEQADKDDLEYYRSLTPNQRLDLQWEMMCEWHGDSFGKVEKVFRFVKAEDRHLLND